MSFLIRNAQPEDLEGLYDLANQFHLLNMPADKTILSHKIERSVASFAGELEIDKAEYLFLIQDPQIKSRILGCSQIIAKHGNPGMPHYSFQVKKVNKFSEDLGVGFIHKVLRFKEDLDGPTEIGGLLVDKSMRRRPEKLGKQISLIRFLYMAMHRDRFKSRVLCELTPPLLEDGRSEFWEAVGRRFTGLPYDEADELSQTHKEFIRQLFPEQDIYLALIDSRARLSLGKVGQETIPAQMILEKIGFKNLEEIDPFDGGPHFGVDTKDITIVKSTVVRTVSKNDKAQYNQRALLGVDKGTDFLGAYSLVDAKSGGNEINIPQPVQKLLGLESGQKIFVSLLDEE
ncbi:MAG: arginine N-succinyltransferase [Proteobacteria bacterium SG_bin7]|nr:MAG: arginine N-succinyltransferase [Proteobacteria bacterium SG_bin7]